MPYRHLHFLLAGFFILAPTTASADCVEEPRQVALTKDSTVRLKAYRCGTEQGQKGSQFRLEFHRLSQTAASIVVGKVDSSVLRATLGAPKIAQNDVFKSYADLLQQFAYTEDVPADSGTYRATTSISGADGKPDDGVSDTVSARKLRTFRRSSGDFPASAEIAALRKKSIPEGMKIFYSITCDDENADSAKNPVCKTYDVSLARQNFWRGLRASDVAAYAQRVKDYNAQVAKYASELRASRKKDSVPPEKWTRAAVPSDLRLLKHVAGDNNWPDDLAILAGFHIVEPCVPQQIEGWSFTYYGRDLALDVVLIENTSAQPIKIDQLVGSRVAEPRLRPMSTSAAVASAPLDSAAETLAPGQKLLVPVAVVLVPTRELGHEFTYPQASETIFGKLGAKGFVGSPAASGAPTFRDYAFGPSLNVGGAVIDGKRVDLAQRSANFFDLTFSNEIGSCPFLLSYDDADREWIEHGKVLHRATGKAREETESRSFEGFRSRFRLEEREAEVAFIDHVALQVTLKSGDILKIDANEPDLAARDGAYMRLFWGETVELAFDLPKGIDAEDVVSSRLDVTGYYERYANLLAGAEELPVAPRTFLRRAASAIGQGPVCALPARPAISMKELVPVD